MEHTPVIRPVRLLPETVANQIAAGEVVERPASVLKELVENAIDAGARRVRIEVDGGGRRLIRVVDDGHGMSPDDMLLALERHATSKLTDAADLERVGTLGFRGEALPSIAAVSRLTITSRQAGAEVGARIVIEGGVIGQQMEIGCRVGSTVEMRDLFFNTPARRKFLRGQITENGHLGATLTRLALGWPGVAFQYVSGGKTLHELPATADLAQRTAGLLGRETATALVALDGSLGRYRLWGLAATPALSRSSADQVFTFVNGRFVRDKTLLHAVGAAYHGLLPADRRPVAVLHLELDPELVDVNVHPAKIEVRFREPREIHDAVTRILRQGLAGAPRPAPAQAAPPEAPPAPQGHEMPPIRISGGVVAEPTLASWRQALDGPPPGLAWSPPPAQGPASAVQQPVVAAGPAAPVPAPLFGAAAELEVIGQLHGLYVLCAAPDGLVVMDQHAAHERLTFERLKRQAAQGRPASQGLLHPATLELSPQEAAWAQLQAPAWAALGLELAPFGGNTWAVRALPAVAAGVDPAPLTRDLLAAMATSGLPVAAPEFLEAAMVSLACHGSIRQGQRLGLEQMRELVRQAAALPPPVTCPHGRPVFLLLGRRELARAFKRGAEPRP